MRKYLLKIWFIGSRAILAGFVLITGISASFIGSRYSTAKTIPEPNIETVLNVEAIRRSGLNSVVVPAETAKRMGLATATVSDSNRRCPTISFTGCLAFDNDALIRIHSRFSGELVSIGQTEEGRPLRLGDKVKSGQLLAIVWSKDLGEKKSELCDAVSKLSADTTTFQRLKDGGVSERSVLEAERIVQADRIAVERAERTLRTWRLSESEIATIRDDAGRIKSDGAGQSPHSSDWAKVEVRSSLSGTIVEKSGNPGDIIDTTATIFTIGDLTNLAVWAHIYEEDLPLLNSLPKPIEWTITLPSQPDVSSVGTLEQISSVIDPNQHTALALGRVKNPSGSLKVGQSVKVSVTLPRSTNEIKLPVDAVIEDGRESIVFLQSNEKQSEFVRCPVHVTRRFRDVIYVKTDPERIRLGNSVVTAGALLLRDAVDQLPPSNGRQ